MVLATLLAVLATTPAHAPLKPEHFSARLLDAPSFVQPQLEGRLFGGINQIVSGSILTVVGGALFTFGVYGLITASAAMETAKLVWTVLGWTFFGMGAIVMLVGIPILIVGIVRVATRDGTAALGLTRDGQLAVTF